MRLLSTLLAALSTVLAFSPDASAQEFNLVTTYAAGNGQSGNMFDIRADVDMVITRLDMHINSGSSTVEIYSTPNTYVGSAASSANWTLLGTAAVTGMGTGVPTPIPLQLNIPLSAGQSIGIYATTSSGASVSYTNGSTVGSVFVSDGNLTFYEGIGLSYPFGGSFSPRVWNGTIYYTTGDSADQEGYKQLQIMDGPHEDAGFGTSATRVGDYNLDGHDDYAIGVPGSNSGRGGFEIHDAKTGAVLQKVVGGLLSRAAGAAMIEVGDTDGDGTSDLLVGAPGDTPLFTGFAYLYRNHSPAPSATLIGPLASGFGAAVSPLGDIDGDSMADFAVGSPIYDGVGANDAGAVYLYSGATAGLIQLMESGVVNEHFGSAIISIGDVNGDLVPDFAVGAPGASLDPLLGDHRGRVDVYSGFDRSVEYTLFGSQDSSEFGAALELLGDVDGDGFEDFAVGAPLHGAGLGAVFAYSGKDGTPLYDIHGDEPDRHFGSSLALFGDTNGNGKPELAVGAPGGTGLWGYVRLLDAATGAQVTRLVQGFSNTLFGTAMVSIGDINGDPLEDFVVTAPQEYVPGSPAAGRARVVTTLGLPVVTDIHGVHNLDSGEAVVTGSNLVNVQAYVNGVPTPSTYISPAELRIPLAPSIPGGFDDLRLTTAEGQLALPASLPRYPALATEPASPLGEPIEITLANGEPGIYVLAFSPYVYASPAPFTNFGWYYGLELNGVWTLAVGNFTPTETTRTVTIPGPTSVALKGMTFYLQAFTTQNDLGYAGFSDTLSVTLESALP